VALGDDNDDEAVDKMNKIWQDSSTVVPSHEVISLAQTKALGSDFRFRSTVPISTIVLVQIGRLVAGAHLDAEHAGKSMAALPQL